MVKPGGQTHTHSLSFCLVLDYGILERKFGELSCSPPTKDNFLGAAWEKPWLQLISNCHVLILAYL